MQDRFKFRCFSLKTKKMYEVDSLHLDSKDGEWVWVHYYNPIYDKDLKIQIVQPHAVLMQCTGLKDKNGKLIYEGDIIKFKDNITINGSKTHISAVKFNEQFNTYMYHAECMGLYTINKAQNKKFDVEVIGNIYENSELLEE